MNRFIYSIRQGSKCSPLGDLKQSEAFSMASRRAKYADVGTVTIVERSDGQSSVVIAKWTTVATNKVRGGRV